MGKTKASLLVEIRFLWDADPEVNDTVQVVHRCSCYRETRVGWGWQGRAVAAELQDGLSEKNY